MSHHEPLDELIQGFIAGERRALAKIITIIESTSEEGKSAAAHVLSSIPRPKNKTTRLAISGPPGVGKSTFINTLGRHLVEMGHRIAILPIDPSSEFSFGSILADKTRMKDVMSSERVFIRPSPSKGVLGGVARATKDVLFAMESFGFDVVIIETVGVGQSETLAKALVDHFVVLMQPGSGDQLQAMKKGILEIADYVLVNKADGEQERLARKAKNSLKFFTATPEARRPPYVAAISAEKDRGVKEFLTNLWQRHAEMDASGELAEHRRKALHKLFLHCFREALLETIITNEKIVRAAEASFKEIAETEAPLTPAIRSLVQELGRSIDAGDALN